MRKLILKMSISADGYATGPKGENDWIFSTGDEESKAWVLEQVSGAGVHVMGRGAFKEMGPYWPTSTDVFAKPMNEIPKVVFSRSGRPAITVDPSKLNPTSEKALASWTSARVASGPLVDEINALKREDGKYLLAQGGVSFVQSLIQAGLIDEYRLAVHPVLLGGGRSPFAGEHARQNLELVDLKRFKRGCVAYTYVKK